MKRTIWVLCMCFAFIAEAQEEATLSEKIDQITFDWDEHSIMLNSYEGLSKFCTSAEYRLEFTDVLKSIHHYDSVLYDRLKAALRFKHDKEIEKTIKDIEKFEGEYDMRHFLTFLKQECDTRTQIEHDAKNSRTDIGENSYDGQVYIIETELNKYVKHITKRVDNIREHVHHLHIK